MENWKIINKIAALDTYAYTMHNNNIAHVCDNRHRQQKKSRVKYYMFHIFKIARTHRLKKKREKKEISLTKVRTEEEEEAKVEHNKKHICE